MQGVDIIPKRRGGDINTRKSHQDWLSTISRNPDVIAMTFVPISSLLGGVPGSGFLSQAIKLYLRCMCPLSPCSWAWLCWTQFAFYSRSSIENSTTIFFSMVEIVTSDQCFRRVVEFIEEWKILWMFLNLVLCWDKCPLHDNNHLFGVYS
jgi:hypothetical protein